MDDNGHHNELITAVREEYDEILNGSNQAVYIFLDDDNKACNRNFSDLLGYESPEEWARMEGNFPDLFVDSKSQQDLVTGYQNAMENYSASVADITWKTKDGNSVNSKVILVPITYKEHLFALHFVDKA